MNYSRWSLQGTLNFPKKRPLQGRPVLLRRIFWRNLFLFVFFSKKSVMTGCFLFFVFLASVWVGTATISPLSPLLTSSSMIKSSSASGSLTGSNSSSSSYSLIFSTAIAILITISVLSAPNNFQMSLTAVKNVYSRCALNVALPLWK